MPQASAKWTDDTSILEGKLGDLQQLLHRERLEENLFNTVVEGVLSLRDQVQRRIDKTCAAVGLLWLHLVFFSTLQVLAISVAICEHATGMLAGVVYRWWWLLQDFFHLGGGVVLLTAAVGLLCAVCVPAPTLCCPRPTPDASGGFHSYFIVPPNTRAPACPRARSRLPARTVPQLRRLPPTACRTPTAHSAPRMGVERRRHRENGRFERWRHRENGR